MAYTNEANVIGIIQNFLNAIDAKYVKDTYTYDKLEGMLRKGHTFYSAIGKGTYERKLSKWYTDYTEDGVIDGSESMTGYGDLYTWLCDNILSVEITNELNNITNNYTNASATSSEIQAVLRTKQGNQKDETFLSWLVNLETTELDAIVVEEITAEKDIATKEAALRTKFASDAEGLQIVEGNLTEAKKTYTTKGTYLTWLDSYEDTVDTTVLSTKIDNAEAAILAPYHCEWTTAINPFASAEDRDREQRDYCATEVLKTKIASIKEDGVTEATLKALKEFNVTDYLWENLDLPGVGFDVAGNRIGVASQLDAKEAAIVGTYGEDTAAGKAVRTYIEGQYNADVENPNTTYYNWLNTEANVSATALDTNVITPALNARMVEVKELNDDTKVSDTDLENYLNANVLSGTQAAKLNALSAVDATAVAGYETAMIDAAKKTYVTEQFTSAHVSTDEVVAQLMTNKDVTSFTANATQFAFLKSVTKTEVETAVANRLATEVTETETTFKKSYEDAEDTEGLAELQEFLTDGRDGEDNKLNTEDDLSDEAYLTWLKTEGRATEAANYVRDEKIENAENDIVSSYTEDAEAAQDYLDAYETANYAENPDGYLAWLTDKSATGAAVYVKAKLDEDARLESIASYEGLIKNNFGETTGANAKDTVVEAWLTTERAKFDNETYTSESYLETLENFYKNQMDNYAMKEAVNPAIEVAEAAIVSTYTTDADKTAAQNYLNGVETADEYQSTLANREAYLAWLGTDAAKDGAKAYVLETVTYPAENQTIIDGIYANNWPESVMSVITHALRQKPSGRSQPLAINT